MERFQTKKTIDAYTRVGLARDKNRPGIADYIDALFTDFFCCRGDRIGLEDEAILGGVARFHDLPVTVIGHRKGKDLEENVRFNFGMPQPEGYRKALRLMKQAEKFGRPIITFIDTPGAYPGLAAEEHGQSQAIAECLAEMSSLKVPVISIVTGEGNSGGALAIGVANEIYMLEHAVYSILSPEGFASILWKDASRSKDACELMKLTADELYKAGFIEGIIREPEGGIQADPEVGFAGIDKCLQDSLQKLCALSGTRLQKERYEKFRNMAR
ncbi:MAG: acetyl-CoA carboxylase carboxyltransferase subunit alpha [Lachnospiraceae bacterium]|nr:acetyl-CoA carboxylase carboxyltransferase subunit alpha [Lachnospiraceae bacterium]